MSTTLTRQDLVAITDSVRNKIIDRLITRRDVQMAADNARDRLLNTMNAFHVESQTLIRQTSNQTDQVWRRIASMEQQLVAARQDIRLLTQAVNRLYDYQIQVTRLSRTGEIGEQV